MPGLYSHTTRAAGTTLTANIWPLFASQDFAPIAKNGKPCLLLAKTKHDLIKYSMFVANVMQSVTFDTGGKRRRKTPSGTKKGR